MSTVCLREGLVTDRQVKFDRDQPSMSALGRCPPYSGVRLERVDCTVKPRFLFLKNPDNSNQKLFPLDLFRCNFTPNISNFLISQTNFCFQWRFEKSKLHCFQLTQETFSSSQRRVACVADGLNRWLSPSATQAKRRAVRM